MGTTTFGLPYPEPTDPVAEGAAAIRELAEAVNIKLPALNNSHAAIKIQGSNNSILSTNASGTARITFPSAYGTPPLFVCNDAYAGWSFITILMAITATYADVQCRYLDNAAIASGTVVVSWIAIGQ